MTTDPIHLSSSRSSRTPSFRRSSEWFNWPNRISLARLVLVAPLVACLTQLQGDWSGARRTALWLYLVMAASDALDGFLARRMGQQSNLGKFLDPAADKVLNTCAVILLACESTSVPGARLPWWVPATALGKDVLTVMGYAAVRWRTGRSFVKPRTLGKACTLVQSVMVAATLLYPDLPETVQPGVGWLWILAGGLAVMALGDYIWAGWTFSLQVMREEKNGQAETLGASRYE